MAAVPSPRPSGARQPADDGPRLRVVDEPRHTTRYAILLAVVAVLGVTGIVSLNALAAEASFEASKLEKDVAELSHRYDELTAEVAALESPERVRRVAVSELGMVPADPVYLDPARQGASARPADGDAQDGSRVGGDAPVDADGDVGDTAGGRGGEPDGGDGTDRPDGPGEPREAQ